MSLFRGEEKLNIKVEVEVLRRENEVLKLQISDLQNQRQQLMDQNKQLQDALVSKNAPQAYIDQKMDQLDKENSEVQIKKPNDQINTFLKEYMLTIEQPSLFTSAEDMITKLTQVSGNPLPKQSVHNNEES